MITFWSDMAAIRAFAGENPERAVFYVDDEALLVEPDLHVTHQEVYAAEL